jgi:hypothetical protein
LVRIVGCQAQGIGEIGIHAVGLHAPEGGLQGSIDVPAHPVQRAGIVIE